MAVVVTTRAVMNSMRSVRLTLICCRYHWVTGSTRPLTTVNAGLAVELIVR